MKIFLFEGRKFIIFEDSLFIEAEAVNREEVPDTLVINGVKLKGLVKRKYKKRKLGKIEVADTPGHNRRKTEEEWIEILNYSEEHSIAKAAKYYGVSASGISIKKKQFKDKRVWAPPGEEFRVSGGAGPGPITDYRCQNQECGKPFKSNLPPEKAICPHCRVPVQA